MAVGSDCVQTLTWGGVEITETSEPWVRLSMPLTAGSSRPGGVVYGIVNLSPLWRMMEEFRVSKEGRAYIVDGAGRLIAASDPGLVLRGLSLAHRPFIKELISRAPARASLAHGTYTNETGTSVSATGMLIPAPAWGVVVEQPVALLFVSIRQRLWSYAGLFLSGSWRVSVLHISSA